MSDPTHSDSSPETFADLPMQPTGSGVADLEIAYEQMKVAEGADADRPEMGVDNDPTGLGRSAGIAESEAHPS